MHKRYGEGGWEPIVIKLNLVDWALGTYNTLQEAVLVLHVAGETDTDCRLPLKLHLNVSHCSLACLQVLDGMLPHQRGGGYLDGWLSYP